MAVGRKIGSKVKLTPAARKLYPQYAGKIGRITKREILTPGHGLMRSAYKGYRVSYFVRFEGERRDYFFGANHLMKA